MPSLEEAAARLKVGEYRWTVQEDIICYNAVGLLVLLLLEYFAFRSVAYLVGASMVFIGWSMLIELYRAQEFLNRLKKYMDKYYAE